MAECQASVVVATRQRSGLLPQLMRALAHQRLADFEIVCIDDGSTDDTAAVLEGLARAEPRLKFHRLDARGGPAAARNVGWRSARGEVVAFTDDDCIPDPAWLSQLVAAHADGVQIVQGRTESDDTPRTQRGAYSNVVEIREFSYLYQTCNISYRREVLEKLDGFDESFGFSAGGAPNGEDADLGWRAAESGASTTFATHAVVTHPVVPRTFRDSLVARLRAFRMVYFVRRHPGFREHAYRRFFFQRSHPYAAFSLAAVVPLLATQTLWSGGVAVAGLAPYAYFRWHVDRPVGRRRHLPILIAGTWVIDCAEVLVMLTASVRWRTLFI